MKKEFEDVYAVIEEKHPWFVARRHLFESFVKGDEESEILDFGCGTGLFLAHLKQAGFRHLEGVEPSTALRAKTRDDTIPIHSSLPDKTYDVMFMLDVLEHLEDDRAALARMHQALKPGGRFFISVPAHPFLWSKHDEKNMHFRRYSKAELVEKLDTAGFRIDRLTYWNMFTFPPLCLMRLFKIGDRSCEVEMRSPALFLLTGGMFKLENMLVGRGINLPMGVSLIAIVQREE